VFPAAAATATATVSWRLPTTNRDGAAVSTITDQTVKCSTTKGGPYSSTYAVGNGVSTSKQITGLSVGTPIYCVVTQTSAGGESLTSAEVSITP